jgi:PAS domain S-box-containing protein
MSRPVKPAPLQPSRPPKPSRGFHFEWDVLEDRMSYSPEAAAWLGGGALVGAAGHAAHLARIHPEERAAYRALIAGLSPQDPSYRTRYRLRGPGCARRVAEHGFARFDAQGRLLRLQALVSEDRRAPVDQGLADGWRRREDLDALFHAAFDNAAVGVAHVDLDGRFLRLNRTLCEITGYAADELAQLQFQDITHPDDLASDLRQARGLLAGEIADYSMEKRYIRKDGSIVWVKLTGSLMRGADAAPEYFIAIIDDISARKRAEAKAATLVKVVETSVDFIGVAGLDGRARHLNRAGQALVGLDGDAAVRATRIEDYLFAEDLPFVRETVMPAVLRDGRWAGEFRFRHFASGEAIDVYWDIVRIDDADTGEPAQIATVTRDIRAQKATEAALREANRRKDEFLAVMGHELRNPMAPIRHAVDVLRLLEGTDDPRFTQSLDILDRQTRHLSRLLDDLLDVARIVRGRLRLERRPVELRGVVAQSVEAVQPLIRAHRHHLDVALPPPDLFVDGDPVRLTQILLNLLRNAASYTQAGGHIRIDNERPDPAWLLLRVIDDGPGIPPDRLEDLFAPFSQGHAMGRESPAGLGLGLTISRRLAQLHGGRLEAISHWPAPGTEFTLHLPVGTRPDQAKLEDTRMDSEKAAAALRILVVDDNDDVAAAMAMLLQALGHQVQTAPSGERALSLAAQWRPRVALIDIGLPDMDGMELGGHLRALQPDREELLLVAVTGYGHEEARRRSLAAGFDQHLAKPVDQSTLLGLLADVLPSD